MDACHGVFCKLYHGLVIIHSLTTQAVTRHRPAVFVFSIAIYNVKNYLLPFAFTLIFKDIYTTESNIYDNYKVNPIGAVVFEKSIFEFHVHVSC